MIFLSILIALGWPKNPQWHLQELRMSQEQLNTFIGIVTGQTNQSEPLPFSASVAVFNPNFLGTTVDSGPFFLQYKGESMGNGTLRRLKLGARSSSLAEVEIRVDISPSLGKHIMADALANNFEIVVDAQMEARASVGPLHVEASVQCGVTADTMKVLKDPNNVLVGHECSYGLR